MMNQWSLEKIALVVEGILHPVSGGAGHRHISGISTDSRHIKPGDLFVAISGDQFDGHQFVTSALDQGAAGALVSDRWYSEHGDEISEHGSVVSVPNVLKAFQRLAGWYRSHFKIPVVAVTGSNGKTTTKDMIAAVLETRYHLLKTPGNLNSQVGTPQVLLSLEKAHNMAVLELGMNHAGEMSRLAEMVQPTVAVITNVGPAHMAYLKTLEGVGQAKGELLDFLSPDGLAILNADDPHVMAQKDRMKARIMTFGTVSEADMRLKSITPALTGSTFELMDGSVYHLHIPGAHQVMNAMAAIAVGRHFQIPDETIKTVISTLQPSPMRMHYMKIGDLQVLDDTYNANPASTLSALNTLATSPNRKIAVLGDMLELGDMSPSAHRQVGQAAAECADLIVAVGEWSREVKAGAITTGMGEKVIFQCNNTIEAADLMPSLIKSEDVILVKGSRGMKMETIVEAIRRFIETGNQTTVTT